MRSQYFESRGGKFDEVVFFGLQYFIKRYLCGVVVTQEKIDYAKEMLDSHMGPGHFNEEGWKHILTAHGGMLPMSIKAVPEGTVVPTKNVLFTMVNTDPKCYWLTNYLETLLVQVCAACAPTTTARATHAPAHACGRIVVARPSPVVPRRPPHPRVPPMASRGRCGTR